MWATFKLFRMSFFGKSVVMLVFAMPRNGICLSQKYNSGFKVGHSTETTLTTIECSCTNDLLALFSLAYFSPY